VAARASTEPPSKEQPAPRQRWKHAEEKPLETGPRMIRLRESAVLRHDWWRIGRYVAIGALTLGFVGIVAYLIGELGTRTDTPSPTVAAMTSVRDTQATVETTQPSVTVEATSAPDPSSTTTTPFIQAIGDAIPVNDLRMSIYGIGDLRIGDPADQVAGVLTATFGQPDFAAAVEPATAHPGACVGSTNSVLRWGILEITLSDGTFNGYRIDMSLGDPDSVTAELRTASGLRVGATVSTLETIYKSYQVTFVETTDFGSTFSLRRSSGEVLFWGPVSSTDRTGLVLGVYSPSNCD